MNILVIAAHPDDEVLGCGATIAKHTSKGDEVHVLILGQGVMSRTTGANKDKERDNKKKLTQLKQQAQSAANILGVKALYLHDFPDNSFDTVSLLEIVKVIESYKERIKPSIVYTHHFGDLNIDHRLTFQAVAAAFRPIGAEKTKKILCFEILSSSEWFRKGSDVFIPNYYVDVNSTLKKKLDALGAYHDEIRDFPHPRSLKAVEALSLVRGSEVGFHHAEAFYLFRSLEE